MTERINYSSNKFHLELPYLVEVQKASYDQFLQKGIPAQKRLKVGLERVFQDIFPITDMKELFSLKYEGYFFGIPKYNLVNAVSVASRTPFRFMRTCLFRSLKKTAKTAS